MKEESIKEVGREKRRERDEHTKGTGGDESV